MIMRDTNNTAQMNKQEDAFEIDIAVLLRDLLRSFSKLWWLAIMLAVIVAAGFLVTAVSSYRPIYKAEATFTVETYSATQSGYAFFYDNRTAAQMAKTFPYLLDSDLLLERVKADLGVEVLNGTPSAKVVDNSNLFTLTVTSQNPQAAYDILQALIKNYPAVAEYVIGKTQLNMIDYPEFPSVPDNSTQHLVEAAKGGVIGFALGLCIVLIHALLRNTVRQESDITDKLHSVCLGVIPMVILKGNRKKANLSIQSSKVGSPFRESFRGLALHTERLMEDRKVLLLTATSDDEGNSTIAQNLTEALIEQGKNVVLLGSDPESLQKIQQARENADYVLIDAPACKNLSKIAPFAEQAEAIIYTIRQDYSKLPRVMKCFEDLNQFDAKLIGCVLSGARAGVAGYGYGYTYGYGYGSGYHYGRYKNYGYGEENGGKFADNE